MISAIIFDMDGLMVDTEPLSRQAWEQILASFGYEMDNAVYGRMIGLRSDESVRVFLDAYQLPLTPQETRRKRDALFNEKLAQGIPVMPGLHALHAEIARRGLPWAVATSSPRRHAQEILSRLNLLENCRAIVGGDEAARGKPAPDIYLLAAARLGVPPRHCLALEDSLPGCQAAASAGMVTIAIPNGVTKTAVFPCAHHIFNSLHDVAAILDTVTDA